MPVPNDGTTNLPSDLNTRYYWAWWDAVNSVYRAPRGDANGNGYTLENSTDATSATQPTGGSGVRGWLSGLYMGIGTPADASTLNTVIGRLKSILGSLAGGLPAALTALGNLKVSLAEQTSATDAGNSSTSTIGGNGTFTGSTVSSVGWGSLTVSVLADVASAAGGLQIQQSQDGTHWDTVDSFSVAANTALETSVQLTSANFRVVYTNGASAQGTFRLQTIKWPQNQAIPRSLTPTGSLRVGTNAARSGGVLHRNAVTTSDKLFISTVGSATGQTDTGGSLASGTTYNYAVAAYNRWGVTTTSTPQAASPGGSNNSLRIPITQVGNADGYDVFLSTDTNPKWVCRITEAQRASGGVVTAVGGSVAAGGAANSIDIGVVGTGVQNNSNPFAYGNAYTPQLVTAVNCAGYSLAHVLVKLAVTDMRTQPGLNILPFFSNQQSGSDWHAGQLQTLGVLTNVGQPLEQDFRIPVDGATSLVIAIDNVFGQGAAASIWIEMS